MNGYRCRACDLRAVSENLLALLDRTYLSDAPAVRAFRLALAVQEAHLQVMEQEGTRPWLRVAPGLTLPSVKRHV